MPHSSKHDFGKRVAAWRRSLGLDQRTVAQRAKIKASYLSRVERGRINPTVKTAQRIAEGLDVPLVCLLSPHSSPGRGKACPLTCSGRCVLDLVRKESARARTDGAEFYSPRDLRLMRQFMALVRQADGSLLKGFEELMGRLVRTGPGGVKKAR
jgi:transcriptional regulator with XRE-family HTH domain